MTDQRQLVLDYFRSHDDPRSALASLSRTDPEVRERATLESVVPIVSELLN